MTCLARKSGYSSDSSHPSGEAGTWRRPEATATEDADDSDILDRLAALVEQSLVVAEVVADEARYRLLEPIHEYAREALEACGEAEDAGRRHAEYYLALAERAGPELEGPTQGIWIARLEREYDNMSAAIGWMLAAGRYDLVARLGWALHIFWAMRGHHHEGRYWIEEALSSHGLAPLDEARALGAVGLLARMHGDYDASSTRLGEALARFRALGDTPGILVTLSRLGHTVRLQGDLDRAQRLAEEGLALARAMNDRGQIVWMLDVLGLVALTRGAYAETTTIYAELSAACENQSGTSGTSRPRIPTLALRLLVRSA